MDGRHSRWDTDGRRCHVCPDTETLSLTYLPDRVHWPTITADRAKPNPLPTAMYNQVFKKLLSTYEPKPDLKVASEDQIIEAVLSLDNIKIVYDAIKVLELVRNVKIVYLTLKAWISSMSYLNLPNTNLFWTHEKHEDRRWHSKEESQWQINWKFRKETYLKSILL